MEISKRRITTAVAVALLGGYGIGLWSDTTHAEEVPTIPTACEQALDHARHFIANGRYSWEEAQALVNAGRLSTDPDTRPQAETTVRYLDVTISAREDMLEIAERQFYAAQRGCHA